MSPILRPRLGRFMLFIGAIGALFAGIIWYRRFEESWKTLRVATLSVDYWTRVGAATRLKLASYESLPESDRLKQAGSIANWEGYRRICRAEIEADARLASYYDTLREKHLLAIRHPWDRAEPDPPKPADPPRVYSTIADQIRFGGPFR